VSHKKRDEFEERLPVHVTLRLAKGLPTLRRGHTHYVLRQVLIAGAQHEGFRLVHYAAMGNHIHIVCEADNHERLSRGMQGVCVRIAQTLNRWWGRCGKVFADRFHSHPLRSPTEVRNALAYVLKNAHHHKLVLNGELDPFSSAAWFDGWSRTPRGSTGLAPRAVLPMAQTWLMTSGWKRLGLLDPGGEDAHKQTRQRQPTRNSQTTRTSHRSARPARFRRRGAPRSGGREI
jgi:REP element-mobilizing transposase RayT